LRGEDSVNDFNERKRRAPPFVVIAAMALAGLSPQIAAAQAPAPLDVTLSPQTGAGTRMGVALRIPAPAIAAGKPLLRMPIVLVGIPTAAYRAAAISATDDRGALSLAQSDEAPGASGTYRSYTVDRATVGDVRVRYATPPRQVDATTRNGPLFDLRAEDGGMNGAGVYFFAIPANEAPYTIRLHWDLPAGTRGISSHGEGDQSWVAPAETLAFSFYATGNVHSIPADGSGDFVFYWQKQPPFDPAVLGASTRKLYQAMARFFGDTKAAYRVFARANPYPAGGGTALSHSFLFGYGADGTTIGAGTDMLIAHEMAHTWPTMSGEHPLTAWYTEGTAEYYSTLLALRAGTIDLPRFLKLINDKAEGYYTSPFRSVPNAEAGERFWSDARAQKLPYARGFLYFATLNAQIRNHSNDKRSLDDLVLEVLRRQRAGETIGLVQWRALVVAELGAAAGTAFDAMQAGALIVPPANAFGPCLAVVKTSSRPFELGYDEMRLGVVKDLRADSAAARAGLKENDAIVSSTPMAALQSDPSREMNLTVRRAGQTLQLHYVPRGKPVESWQWRNVATAASGSCRL
jgi:hypothetical protein